MMVTMAKNRLKVTEYDMLNGRHGDQQVRAGTVVELEKYYSVNVTETSDIGDEAGKMIESFVSGEIVDGVKSILTRGANIVFGNKSAGETEYSQMLVVWEHGTLVRIDVYHWKYQFSSNRIMKTGESIYAVLGMKRVVDIGQVRSPVLVYSIARAAESIGKKEGVVDLVNQAKLLHNEAKILKNAVEVKKKTESASNPSSIEEAMKKDY